MKKYTTELGQAGHRTWTTSEDGQLILACHLLWYTDMSKGARTRMTDPTMCTTPRTKNNSLRHLNGPELVVRQRRLPRCHGCEVHAPVQGHAAWRGLEPMQDNGRCGGAQLGPTHTKHALASPTVQRAVLAQQHSMESGQS